MAKELQGDWSLPLKGPLHLLSTVGSFSAKVHGPFDSVEAIEDFIFQTGEGIIEGAAMPLHGSALYLLRFDSAGKGHTLSINPAQWWHRGKDRARK